jgi:hypothetical protein
MERSLEELVWQRAGSCCEYCLVPQAVDLLPFEIDHIIAQTWRRKLVLKQRRQFPVGSSGRGGEVEV